MQINGVLKPENIVVGLNVGYTVPAGKVAKVNVALDTSSSMAQWSSNNFMGTGSSSVGLLTRELTLRAGDILNSSRSTGATSGSNLNPGGEHATATVTMTLNAVNCLTVSARSAGGGYGSTNRFYTAQGTANFGFVAEEYFE